MTLKDAFLSVLERQLFPQLAEQGFRGDRRNVRRTSGECIHVVNIQGWRYGGERAANVGVTFLFLPGVNAKRPTLANCEFCRRVGAPAGHDRWFQFGGTIAEAEASARELGATLLLEVPLFFDRWGQFPDAYRTFGPESILNLPLEQLPPLAGNWRSVPRYALFFARMWVHLLDRERAQAFARLGLEHLDRATALRSEFESILGVA